jgi:hypothetical protein
MQAAERGEKIEFRYGAEGWLSATESHSLVWNWEVNDYRVAPRTLDIAVVAWKGSPQFPFVLNKYNYEGGYDKDQIILLNLQTITF